MSEESLLKQFENGISQSFSLLANMTEEERSKAIASLLSLVNSASRPSSVVTKPVKPTKIDTRPPRLTKKVRQPKTAEKKEAEFFQKPPVVKRPLMKKKSVQRNASEQTKASATRKKTKNTRSLNEPDTKKPFVMQVIKVENGIVVYENIEVNQAEVNNETTQQQPRIEEESAQKQVMETIRMRVGADGIIRKHSTDTAPEVNSNVTMQSDEGDEQLENPAAQKPQTLGQIILPIGDGHEGIALPEDIANKGIVRSEGHWLFKTDDDQWQCGTCGKVMPFRSNALVHIRVHSKEQPFACDICGKTFSFMTNKCRHMQEKHNYYSITCRLCNAKLETRKAYCDHMKIEHGDRLKKEEQNDTITNLECLECGKVYHNRNSFVSHVRVKHNKAPEQSYDCQICGRKFNHQSNLLRHVKIHSGERPHKCHLCDTGYIERKSLLLHLKKAHNISSSDEQIECLQCKKIFTSKSNLRAHMLVHTKETPFQCAYCLRGFGIKSNLRRHERIHRGERPFTCPVCGKTFTEKRSMLVHHRLHTGEKPYECVHCHKRFAQLSTLQSHTPVHTKVRVFGCNHCPATFLRRSHLAVHIGKKHHGKGDLQGCQQCNFTCTTRTTPELQDMVQTSYECNECQRTFPTLDAMQSHIQEHDISKLYKCQVCDTFFTNLVSCYEHQQRAHPKENALPATIRCSPMSDDFDPNEFLHNYSVVAKRAQSKMKDHWQTSSNDCPQLKNMLLSDDESVESSSEKSSENTPKNPGATSIILPDSNTYIVCENQDEQEQNYFMLMQ